MADTQQQIIDRIEKLRRITVENGATESEQENAKNRVEELTKKYNLACEKEEIRVPTPNGEIKKEKYHYHWTQYFTIDDLNKMWGDDEKSDPLFGFKPDFSMYYTTTANGIFTYWVNGKEFFTPEDALAYLHIFQYRQLNGK